MNDKDRRKELVAEYKRTGPEAGVYRIVNTATGKAALGSARNLAGARNRLEFALTSNSPAALDPRIVADAREYGMDVFRFEVLDVLEIRPEATDQETREELDELEALWRDRFDPSELY